MTHDLQNTELQDNARVPTPAVCAGGCGTPLPPHKSEGYAWGHKTGCKPPKHTDAYEVESEPTEARTEEEEACVQIFFKASQLERIWLGFSPVQKALAVLAGLDAPVPDEESTL